MGLEISNVVECAGDVLPYFTRDRANEILDDLEIEPDAEEAVDALLEVVFVLRRYYGLFLGTTIPRSDFEHFEKITGLAARLESELDALSPVSLARLEDAIEIEAHPGEPFGVYGPRLEGVPEINDHLLILEAAAREIASWRDGDERVPGTRQDDPEEAPDWTDAGSGRRPKIPSYRVWAAQELALTFDDYNPEGRQKDKYQFISDVLGWIVEHVNSSVGVSVKTIQADLHEHGEIPDEEREDHREERELRVDKMFWDWALDR